MSRAASTVTVLAVLPSHADQVSLSEIFTHSNWNLHFVGSLGEAQALMDKVAADVVISDSRLPDGRWHDVMRELHRQPVEPPLIVASHRADEGIWAEVLNLGGYEVLAMPFQAQEVFRSVSLAWRHWRDRLLTVRGVAAGVAC